MAMGDTKIFYTSENSFPQHFDFCYDIIRYILDSCSSPKVYQKLIESCKYFFAKKNVVIINQMVTYNPEWVIYYKGSYKRFKCNKKLWLTSTFFNPLSNMETISDINLFNKVYKCNLECLRLSNQNLAFNQFLFLTESKSINTLDFYNIIIEKTDGTFLRLENILEQLPNLYYFSFVTKNPDIYFFEDTAEKLLELPEFLKLRNFVLSSIIDTLDSKKFCDFIRKNSKRSIRVTFSFRFHSSTPREYKKQFAKDVQELKRKYNDFPDTLIGFC